MLTRKTMKYFGIPIANDKFYNTFAENREKGNNINI